jgi:hypothetical protein
MVLRYTLQNAGFSQFTILEACILRVPLPKGEGAAKRRVRGTT